MNVLLSVWPAWDLFLVLFFNIFVNILCRLFKQASLLRTIRIMFCFVIWWTCYLNYSIYRRLQHLSARNRLENMTIKHMPLYSQCYNIKHKTKCVRSMLFDNLTYFFLTTNSFSSNGKALLEVYTGGGPKQLDKTYKHGK